MKYVLAQEALDDLEGIASFLAQEYPAVAPLVELAIRRTFELILDFPKIGRMTPRPGVRELPVRRFPYLIIFRHQADRIEIIRVFHTSRNPRTK